MITITRRFEFDAGHRVLGHEGKCRNLHGHRYKADVTIRAPALDKLGRVLDFSVVKFIIGGWIDEFWDHNLILHPKDPIFQLDFGIQSPTAAIQALVGRQPYIMPRETNPTAENLAEVLYKTSMQGFKTYGKETRKLKITKVRMWETPNCFADFVPERT